MDNPHANGKYYIVRSKLALKSGKPAEVVIGYLNIAAETAEQIGRETGQSCYAVMANWLEELGEGK